MSWGGLNPALTAWREAINKRRPDRDTESDGGYADAAHGSKSQHQPDADGTVDAFDMDKNVLGSSTPGGSDEEERIVEAMKLDFERDPHKRGHLWIEDREIAQHDEGWTEYYYGGDNPHDKHVHWESRQDHEQDGREWPMPETDKVLGETMPLNNGDVETILDYDNVPNLYGDKATNPTLQVRTALKAAVSSDVKLDEVEARLTRIESKLDQLAAAVKPPASR